MEIHDKKQALKYYLEIYEEIMQHEDNYLKYTLELFNNMSIIFSEFSELQKAEECLWVAKILLDQKEE